MDNLTLASGDNPERISPHENNTPKVSVQNDDNENVARDNVEEEKSVANEVTPQMVEEHEAKLKERIAQCKVLIESLKLELNEEKSKLQKAKAQETTSETEVAVVDSIDDMAYASMVSASVDTKLNCDESLIAYEKQLEKYQNTLNMAQMEKKNAIRKKMLSKAYKLKLMEVENQCNLELLRVKQSLQCLEPLKMIVNKWNNPDRDDMDDIKNLELLPRFPELNFYSGCDFNLLKDEVETDDQKALANADNVNQAENAS